MENIPFSTGLLLCGMTYWYSVNKEQHLEEKQTYNQCNNNGTPTLVPDLLC